MKKFFRIAAVVAAFGLALATAGCSNSSDSGIPFVPGGLGQKSYKVNVSQSIEHGSVTASPESGAAGTEITLTATADQGYVWSSYTVTDAGGAAVAVSAQGKFTMPESDVTVSATFVVGVSVTPSAIDETFLNSLSEGATVVITGQLTGGDLATIKNAFQSPQTKIKLDLRTVTGFDSLPAEVFSGCYGLQEIILPEGITSIGNDAFYSCMYLESVLLPASVTSIGERAFNDCDRLESILLPVSLVSIGKDAFDNSDRLSNINVAQGNTNYSSVNGVLFNKDKTTLIMCPRGKSGSYEIPSGVQVIGKKAFYYCQNLTRITIPNTVTKIEEYAFESVNKLTSLELPDSVIVIEDYALQGCSSLSTLRLSSNLTTIGSSAFSSIAVESIVIPASVTKIGNYVFSSSLTSLTFEDPLGWKCTMNGDDWENRTNPITGVNADFSDPAANATNFKKTTPGSDPWGMFLWYK